MAKFTFTLPNGLLFTLEAPAGTTAVEAERVYLEQLAAGAFIGLSSGDTLQSVETTAIEFAQSRLARGTAGVPDIPLLAIYNDGIISSLPVLLDVPINNGITVSDYVDTSVVTTPIGSLSTAQVQAVLAAIAASVCQPADVITDTLGVGKYGFNVEQLEESGHLKCGTSSKKTTNIVDLLKSPSVWTGKDGVNSVNDILKNPTLQDKIQLGLMKASYTKLVQTGQIITPSTDTISPTGQIYNAALGGFSTSTTSFSNFSTASLSGLTNSLDQGIAALGGLLAISSKFSVDNALAWAKGQIPTIDGAAIKSQMDSLAKQGQFAVNFSDFKLPAALAGVIPAAGFTGTINRTTVNAAFVKLVGSNKIPVPTFSPQAIDTAALSSAADRAKSILNSQTDISNLTAGISASLSSVASQTQQISSGAIQRLGNEEISVTREATSTVVTQLFPSSTNESLATVLANAQPAVTNTSVVLTAQQDILRNSLAGALRGATNSVNGLLFPKSAESIPAVVTTTIPDNNLIIGRRYGATILRNSDPGALRSTAEFAGGVFFPKLT